MDATLALPVLVFLIAVALLFDFLNGLHDAANSIATIVSTRVLRPQYAVIWAAFFNFIAFLVFGLHVANTIGKGIIEPSVVDASVIFAALVGAIVWNLVTWAAGIPSSSSHALIGGLVGAGFGDACADQPADQRVRTGRGNSERPGDQVPDDGAHKCREDHGGIDHARFDDAGADGIGNMKPEHQEGDEVEERCPQHRVLRTQHAGRHDRRDRVGGVVQPVEEVERQRDDDQPHQQRKRKLVHQA